MSFLTGRIDMGVSSDGGDSNDITGRDAETGGRAPLYGGPPFGIQAHGVFSLGGLIGPGLRRFLVPFPLSRPPMASRRMTNPSRGTVSSDDAPPTCRRPASAAM